MKVKVTTLCPYCGHVNESLLPMEANEEKLQFVVSCDDAVEGGCGADYVASVRVKVEVSQPTVMEIVGERDYLKRQGFFAAEP